MPNELAPDLQSVTFNSRISDEDLLGLMGTAEVLEISRGSWLSFVRFYSEEKAGVIDQRIKDWFQNWQEKNWERQRIEGEKKYRESVERFYKDYKGLPCSMTIRGKHTVHGHRFLDDNDEWIYVWPEGTEV